MGMQKPISLDLILYGDSDISYVENITLFNVVPEYIVKNKRFKNNLYVHMIYKYAVYKCCIILFHFFLSLFQTGSCSYH